MPVNLKCESCDKAFKVKPSYAAKHKHHYCSMTCYGKGRADWEDHEQMRYKEDSEITNWYSHVHKWVYRHYGKASKCEQCTKPAKRYEWANVSGEYQKSRDDWRELCPSCHRKYDMADDSMRGKSKIVGGLTCYYAS